MVSSWSFSNLRCPILGSSWRQDGPLSAILALTWPILAPRCAPTDLQVEPQTRPKSHLGPSWRQEGHPGAPNHPWSSNFQGFDPIFDPIFEHIFIIVLQFFPNFQPQVRQGGGFARAAHWIISHHTIHHIRSYHVIHTT